MNFTAASDEKNPPESRKRGSAPVCVVTGITLGSATVPVALVGVPPTSFRRTTIFPTTRGIESADVFGQRPKTAGATPALPIFDFAA